MAPVFKDHFSSHAADYASRRPSYPPALAGWLADNAPATRLALDVGCGSGQMSLLLADRFDRVVATDASANQIAHAVRHPRIDYRVAPAEQSDLADAAVDLITAAQAVHWFDIVRFNAEADRVLKPGGLVALISYVNMVHRGPIEPMVEHFRRVTLADYWPPERTIVETEYRDVALAFDEIAAPGFAIDVAWDLGDMIGYIDTWSAVRAMEARIGRGQFDAFRAELAACWGDPMERRPIRWPLTLRVARKPG